MNSKSPSKFLRVYHWNIAIFCGVFLFFTGLKPVAAEVVAIANVKNPISSLTVIDLRKMYKGKRLKWSHGENIKLFLPPSKSAEMKTILQKVFRFKSEVQISKFYVKAIFQQKFVRLPEATNGMNESILKVAQNPGGIALIDLKETEAKEDIKLIRIIHVDGF
jgi:ABC-type phosphate transport system substrate-binding protein